MLMDRAVEVVFVGTGDGYRVVVADGQGAGLDGNEYLTVDFGGVELGAAYVKFALNAVDDGCQGLSDPLLAEFGGNVGL